MEGSCRTKGVSLAFVDRKGKGVGSAAALDETAAFPFVIPSEAEGSAVQRTRPGNVLPLRTGLIGVVAGQPDPVRAAWGRRASWAVRLSCLGREWHGAWCLPYVA